jgi:hypothetical protein
MAMFELVQRLTDAPDSRPRNIFGDPASIEVSRILLNLGARIDLAYMGSYEYADPKILLASANRIAKAAPKLKIITQQLVIPGVPDESVNFVCTEAQQESLLSEWETWVENPRTLEPSGYPTDHDGVFKDTVGWWALGEDLIWTRQEEIAENIRGAFVKVSST